MNITNECLKKSIEHYGKSEISIIVMEELSELQKATSKLARLELGKKRVKNLDKLSCDEKKLKDNLVEEIADVQICIEYLKLMYLESNADEQISNLKNMKERRIMNRMQGEIERK